MKELLLIPFLCVSTSLNFPVENVNVTYDNNNSNLRIANNEQFRRLSTYPEYVKVIDHSDGYVYYNIFIYKMSFTENSDLYLFVCDQQFTPGYAAHLAGHSTYDSGVYLSEGAVTMGLEKYTDPDNNKNGSNVTFKASWPYSSTTSVTVESTYGQTITTGIADGVSFNLMDGFSFYVESYTENSITTSITTTTNVSDPILTRQFSPTNPLYTDWAFEVQSKDVTGKLTYTLKTFYLFEMDNYSYNNTNRDAFIMHYSVSFNVCYQTLWWYNEKETHTYAARISCFTN